MTNTKINYLDEISNYIFASKYSRYDEKLGRRETWNEAVSRVEKMHLRKYSFLNQEDKNKIKWAFDLVREKRVLPSLRSLQFGGKAIEAKNPRIFNCASRHIDSIRSFSESFFLLLCGCGCDFGISNKFLNRLPDLVDANDKTGTVVSYVVDDSIEGWADSIEALLLCYFKNTCYTGRKIAFDFSRIRKKGTLLKTGGGKAPGYKGLKNALGKVKELLDHIIEYKHQTRLKSIDAYDILMHLSDAVLSGGIRRAATSVTFLKDDIDLINAKTDIKVDKVYAFYYLETRKLGGKDVKFYEGRIQHEGKKYDLLVEEWELNKIQKESIVHWRHIYPQRARSNNSVILLRDKTTQEEFHSIAEKTAQYGEPGYIFANSEEQTYNPCREISFISITNDGVCGYQFCVSGETKLITKKQGLVNISEVVNTDIDIWNGEKWNTVRPILTQQNASLYRVTLSDGSFLDCTENHKFILRERFSDFKELTTLQILDFINKNNKRYKLYTKETNIIYNDGTENQSAYQYGFFKGDGYIRQRNGVIKSVHVNLYGKKRFISPCRITNDNLVDSYGTNYSAGVFDDLDFNLCFQLKQNGIPSEIFNWNKESIINFISGWLDADGCNASKGVRLYADEFSIRDCQLLLSKCGIKSSVNLMSKKGSVTNFGARKCEMWYLQITKTVGLKCRRLLCNNSNSCLFKGKYQTIKSIIKLNGLYDSYCFNESELHQGFFNNILTKQCNLSSINGAKTHTIEEWLQHAEAASIIGTLQAGYTNFSYLSKAAKKLTEEEALLGVSITGFMDNPKLLLNPELQRKAATLVKEINEIWAKKININSAARTTCVKPEASSSLLVGSASGIHPHHSKRYFRRVQANKIESVYKHFKKINPELCEHSVWSTNQTDDVICFPIELINGSMVKSDLTAVQHLEYIKLTQENWVNTGTTKYNKKPITHNVSSTVIVKENEWKEVFEYLYKNKDFFAAVSFIPDTGDKDYPQSPMQAIQDQDDEKLWNHIISNFKSVDYTQFKEDDDNTALTQEITCAGGSCNIV